MNKYLIILTIVLITVAIMTQATALDTDNDSLSDNDENTVYYTNPQNADSDADGFTDAQEIATGFSPRHQTPEKLIDLDSDNDYLNDAWEIIMGTDLMNPDSDGDWYLDGTEVAAGFDPLSAEPKNIKKLIKINLKTQELTYYWGDKELDSFLISSGVAGMRTPKGTFKILAKYPVKHYYGANFDYPNTKWNLHFTTGKYRYYIHGAYWHNNFGTPMSHGCVNVAYEHMEQLYWYAQINTPVVIE